MVTTVIENHQRVSIEITGHGKTLNLAWPQALEKLDEAYTEDIAQICDQLSAYVKVVEAGLVQTVNGLDNIKRLERELRETHLSGRTAD